jgi:uncharacterized protein DUF397
MTEPGWRKSSRSENGGNCVELRGSLDAVRDSKNRSGATLHADVPALVAAIKRGQCR